MRIWICSGLFVLCCVVLTACEMNGAAAAVVAHADLALTPNPCTAVSLTTPAQAFSAQVAQPIALSAAATCPAGVTPEFEFWTKLPGDQNWNTTALGGFLPAGASSTSSTPVVAGGLCFSVVARAVGSTDTFQARSSGSCGTVSPATTPSTSTIVVPAAQWHIRSGSPVLDVRGFWTMERNNTDELVAELPVPPGAALTSLKFHFNRASSPLSGEFQFHLFSRDFTADPTTTLVGSPLSGVVSSGDTWSIVDIATAGANVTVSSGVVYWLSVVGTGQFAGGDPLFDSALIGYSP